MKFKLLGFLVLTGIAVQFIPYGKDHTNPPIVGKPQWDKPRTKELFSRVCAHCHSNTTTWPWYSNVAEAVNAALMYPSDNIFVIS